MSNYGKWYIYPEGPCLTQFFGIEIKPVYTKFAVFERKDFVLTSFPQLGLKIRQSKINLHSVTGPMGQMNRRPSV